MRPSRLLLLLPVLAVGGCLRTTAPHVTAVARPVPAHAQSQPQAAAEAATRATPRPEALAQAKSRLPSPPVQSHNNIHGVVVAALPLVTRAYALDTGDKLRIVVFGQEGLSNSYFVDAEGKVTLPLIGPVSARGLATQQLAGAIAEKLRGGFIREPHIAIEVEVYRPFFILGEVTQPGQYPYIPDMTIETAVAIAGGLTPRAYRWAAKIDRPEPDGAMRGRLSASLLTRVHPGDTIVIKERWF